MVQTGIEVKQAHCRNFHSHKSQAKFQLFNTTHFAKLAIFSSDIKQYLESCTAACQMWC